MVRRKKVDIGHVRSDDETTPTKTCLKKLDFDQGSADDQAPAATAYIKALNIDQASPNAQTPARLTPKSKTTLDIDEIPADAPWLMEGPDGQLVVTKAVNKSGRTTPTLSQQARVALALNEKCCEMGRGMVYSLARHPKDLSPNDFDITSNDAFLAMPTTVLQSLPMLFYLPERWSEARRAEWTSMKPSARLERSTARRGWVGDAVPVLPFHLEFPGSQIPRGACFSGVTECELTVIINPKPYVVATRQIRELCVRNVDLQMKDVPYRTTMVAKPGITWKNFDQWRVPGAKGILEKLEDIFWHGDREVEGRLYDVGALSLLFGEVGARAVAGRLALQRIDWRTEAATARARAAAAAAD